MQRIIESRNKREGRYAGRSNYDREYGRHQGPLRHMRTGPDERYDSLHRRPPPGGWYGDPLGGGWGDA